MRIGKYLAHAGVASRRAAETIVREGRVTVAGQIVHDPARDIDEHAVVSVDGRRIDGPEPQVVYALNKPLGVVSTAKDTHGRPTVVMLLAGDSAPLRCGGARWAGSSSGVGAPASADRLRLYPVGRLDVDSSGLILLTNDGGLAHRLTHPSFEVPKTYRARVGGGPVEEDALRKLREGVRLDDGMTAPARVRRIGRAMLEITIHEGRNRQVRRMCDTVGHPVTALERVAFGAVKLGDLAPGAHRRLSVAELERLRGVPDPTPAVRRVGTRTSGKPPVQGM
jgi:23S rRNA pseudouridine2605 synthase